MTLYADLSKAPDVNLILIKLPNSLEEKVFKPETRILIVDDMATVRRIVGKILKELGFINIQVAADGLEAWNILNSTTIELVISDWNMPGLSGFELLKKCRADARYATVPFVLLTAEAETEQVSEALKHGVSNYIIKPFSADQIKTKLEQTYKKMAGNK